MSADEARKIIEKAEFEVYGIRVDENDIYNIGDTCHNSHNWYLGDGVTDDEAQESGWTYNSDVMGYDCGELNGTCAAWVDDSAERIAAALDEIKMYGRGTVYLIAGNRFDYGWENNEVVIEDARVLAVME